MICFAVILLVLLATSGSLGFVLLPLERRGVTGDEAEGRSLAEQVVAARLHRPELESYLSTTVALGSGPEREFELIVDTGSSLTYVPCTNCKKCGKHMARAKFSAEESNTARSVRCKHHRRADCQCGNVHCQCSHNQCYYEIRYAEGSASGGKLLSDVVRLGPRNSTLRGKVTFGCSTTESGLIYSQKADGILGLSRSKLSLINQLGEGSGAFSVCPAKATGVLAVGRIDEDWDWVKSSCLGGKRISVPYVRSRRGRKHLHGVPLKGLHVGPLSSHNPRKQGSYTMIIDTGSTFSYVPPGLHSVLTEQLEKALAPLAGVKVQGGPPLRTTCFTGSKAGEELSLSDFPPMRLVFPNATMTLGPNAYLYQGRGSGPAPRKAFCLLLSKGKGNEVHLGSIMLENFLVEFDRREVKFMPCDCSRLLMM
ncbi:aspartic peptidase [Chloropicon primus]|nr:aspartic peptidase [Chloropicon primus]UPR03436.1 aspartic peptidase [Chloropicon primus]|eukprot:QDZ24228.1 aspartic peptidase [Chloropicon primus]